MQNELPYLPSYKNVELLFQKIASARAPEAFTQKFLSDILGLKSATDRPLIALLKTLGFLDGSGKPTSAYSGLKNPSLASIAIANAVRKAYKPLFDANENAHKLSPEQLKGLIGQVAGSDAGLTGKISGTFNSLLKISNFEGVGNSNSEEEEEKNENEEKPNSEGTSHNNKGGLRPEFHYNIQIHLPNANEETYLAIFNAIRKTFQ